MLSSWRSWNILMMTLMIGAALAGCAGGPEEAGDGGDNVTGGDLGDQAGDDNVTGGADGMDGNQTGANRTEAMPHMVMIDGAAYTCNMTWSASGGTGGAGNATSGTGGGTAGGMDGGASGSLMACPAYELNETAQDGAMGGMMEEDMMEMEEEYNYTSNANGTVLIEDTWYVCEDEGVDGGMADTGDGGTAGGNATTDLCPRYVLMDEAAGADTGDGMV